MPPATRQLAGHESAASRVDGLVRLAERFLDPGAGHPEAARWSRSRLTVRLDSPSGWARLPDGELLPPAAALTVRDLGRDRREPDRPLRDLLAAIDDERCRFPGCTRRRKLHAHHVQQWSAGGRTDLANLVFLCSRYHTLVHAVGYRLSLRPDTVASASRPSMVEQSRTDCRCPSSSPTTSTATTGSTPRRCRRTPLNRASTSTTYAVSVLMQKAA
jgi:hypothetical protein